LLTYFLGPTVAFYFYCGGNGKPFLFLETLSGIPKKYAVLTKFEIYDYCPYVFSCP
jgi:hypothetical protein